VVRLPVGARLSSFLRSIKNVSGTHADLQPMSFVMLLVKASELWQKKEHKHRQKLRNNNAKTANMVTKRNFGGYVRQHSTYTQSPRFEFCLQFTVFSSIISFPPSSSHLSYYTTFKFISLFLLSANSKYHIFLLSSTGSPTALSTPQQPPRSCAPLRHVTWLSAYALRTGSSYSLFIGRKKR
jgi:hypothetical protein